MARPLQLPLFTEIPRTLTVGGAVVLLDSDEDGSFVGARATDHAAHVLPGVSWGHLEQPQP